MAFGKLSLLIGSFAAAVFNGGNNPSGHSNALFFIGNGSYYSSNPEESVTNPERGDPYSNCNDFIRNFVPDGILSDFTRALHEKEPHIFITAKTWNSLVRIRKRAHQLFAELSIIHPLEQLYVNNTTIIPTPLSNRLEKEITINDQGSTVYSLANAPRTSSWRHPLFFGTTELQALIALPLKQRLEVFKQKATILHPDFYKIFHFLFVIDPSAWHLYHIGNGLYYITPEHNEAEIATHSFSKLDIAYQLDHELAEPQKEQEFKWTQELPTIFACNKKPWRIYISGHGSNVQHTPTGNSKEYCSETADHTIAQIAGMPSKYLKEILTLCNEQIKVERVVVSSCYTPAQRLLDLLPAPYQFDLITPIAHYVPVSGYIPLIYTAHYKPAWISGKNKTELEYTVHNRTDGTQKNTFKKFSTLLNTRISPDLKKYMHKLYDPADQQEPVVVLAGKHTIQKIG